MKALTEYKNKQILAVGYGDLVNIAYSYGFEKVISVKEYSLLFPLLDPWRKYSKYVKQIPDKETAVGKLHGPIEAIFVMHDPEDWGTDLQIVNDILCSNGTPGEGDHHFQQIIPIFFSNPDFLWAAEFNWPRFGQGAFRKCVETLYHSTTGNRLEYTQYGKPETTTYKFVESLLQQQAQDLGLGDVGPIYMIGKNISCFYQIV
eukprot:TRINITY_DN12798_c0_g1_i1.p1 TRINITY_DN12798_c0_g1~~TRINITY_DN12798_c0_g1_i1.p1  ORF type:complete len:222 (-),score=25.24 TRINITY_DN12798_c0_g1_i1:175-783(-)